MGTVSAEVVIDAPKERIFDTVAHIDRLADALPHVVRYEYLTEQTSGEGTRFREVRLNEKNEDEQETELEVVEYVPHERVRLIAEGDGTVWDSVFELGLGDGGTKLSLTMSWQVEQWLVRFMLNRRFVRRMFQKALQRDLEYVKAHLEGEDERWRG